MYQEFVLQLKFYNKNFNKYKPLPRSIKPSLLFILKNPSLQLLPSFSLTPIQSLIYPKSPIALVHRKRNASFPLLFEFDFLCLWFFFLCSPLQFLCNMNSKTNKILFESLYIMLQFPYCSNLSTIIIIFLVSF